MHKYATLMNDIEQKLEDGTIRAGQKTPSIRELSDRHHCSKSTVIRAYMELEKRHLIYSIPQSGYYAVQRKAPAENPSVRTVTDFSSSAPDPRLFPYLDFQHCMNKAIDTYKNDLFAYGTSQGLPSLLKVLSKHLANYQVFSKPDHIFITSGVQQALSILTMMPFPSGKSAVLLEQPSYPMLIRLLECYRIPAEGISRSQNGIDLDELEHLFQSGNFKFFYTIPRFHNPLGTSYSQRLKKEIAKLAERYDVYVVEDDYLADLEMDTKSDPIYAYSSSHVIYLKSFSKIILPGLRVAAAVLPDALKETFSLYKRLSDIDSSMLSQAALEIYIQSGMLERRRLKIKSAYSRRVERLTRTLDTYLANENVCHPSVHAGLHSHISIPAKLSISILLARLKKKRILLESPEPYFLSSFAVQPLLKLSITKVNEEDIEPGVKTILDEISRMSPLT